jgi:superfamily II DNA or RNA helicase
VAFCPVPCLRLTCEPILVASAEDGGFGEGFVPTEMAVLHLSFDYEKGARGRRDPAREAEARRVLEGFGPVEIDQLDTHETEFDSPANYIVDVVGDVDTVCAFTADAVPKLRALGWRVEIADDYPYIAMSADRWYGDVRPSEEGSWFELELGVDVDGSRVDLLPALLELLADSKSAAGLDRRLSRARRDVAVAVGDKYVGVSPERLRRLVRVFKELYDRDAPAGTCRLPEDVPSYLEDLEEAAGDGVTWTVPAKARALSRQSMVRVTAPPELQATLRPYQQIGLDWLQHLRANDLGGVLADDMGLGKTLQTIAHLATEKASGRMQDPCLIVAPTSLLGNWSREIRKFAPHLRMLTLHGKGRQQAYGQIGRVDVAITTYTTLLRDIERLETQHFHVLVLDEAQAIKNPRGRMHAAVKRIDAAYPVCLSGTPIENNLDELWALFDVVAPGRLGTAASFRQNYRLPIEKFGSETKLALLRRRVAPLILRRMKEDVAPELPAKTRIVRAVELGGEQRDLYEGIRVAAHSEVRKIVRKKGIAASTVDILSALMKLRQACCDPKLVRIRSAREIDRSAKLEALLEMVEDMVAGGRRILVFSQFTSMLEIIGAELRARGIRQVTLTGASRSRQALVDEFQAGLAPVFLISLKAGGTGLNLTRADTVIHYDPWWNPAAQAQATDRAYRIGQDKPVFVYDLIVAGSVEERILALQQRKRELAEGVLSNAAASQLSLAEVDDLFAPLD